MNPVPLQDIILNMNPWLKLENEFSVSLQKNVPFKELTTTQIGGPTKYFYQATTQPDLLKILTFASENQLPYLIIGGGSNLLVSDDGVEILVIKNSVSGIQGPTLGVGADNQAPAEDPTLTVQAGTPLQTLVDYTINHGLTGLHKLTGIPGTVGGAIFGNAGAYGQTISDPISEIKIFDGRQTRTLSKNECGFSYRHSNFKLPMSSWLKNVVPHSEIFDQASSNHQDALVIPDPVGDPEIDSHLRENDNYLDKAIILEVTFQFPTSDIQSLKSESQDVLQKRLKKYPPGVRCPGSFFKNLLTTDIPQPILDTIPNLKDYYGKVPSWYFLEQVGAKGAHQGQVQIADFHANLFINLGGATAQDFYQLAKKYSDAVKQKFGITLEPEVQLINLPPL